MVKCMSNDRSNSVLTTILEKIELPERAYEIAEKRYKNIGEWFHRPESACVDLDPHVFPQGSFRLGTANRPLNDEAYDLDMGCNLRRGLSKKTSTQKELKVLVGYELEQYRKAHTIKEELAEKKRCWRMEYADDLNFHMDIVPCIPETEVSRGVLRALMIESTGLDEALAVSVSEFAVSITDNTDDKYKDITSTWRISNPEGYARWFESRMRLASQYLVERELAISASIATLPYHQWKTPLQSAIQILKRHRDTMFEGNEDEKPISVIISTLAARSYNGEGDLVSALSRILNTMDQYIQPSAPHVPNPVNPIEDFADKWYSPEHKHLKLNENFTRWLLQARADFLAICSKNNSQIIVEAADRGFKVNLDKASIDRVLGLSAAIIPATKQIEESNPRPWFKK